MTDATTDPSGDDRGDASAATADGDPRGGPPGPEWTDSRRLTGPNLLLPTAGAVLDVTFGAADPDAVVAAWQRHVGDLLAAVGWDRAQVAVRRFEGGASLAFAAPIDALYAATSVNEAAWAAALAETVGAPREHPDDVIARLVAEVAEESDPARIALRDAARARGVAFLWDDDAVTVGQGCGSRTWPTDALPDASTVDWSGVRDVPVALVTGTNGKSTTVRMLAGILGAAGHTTGLTSTDGIVVGGDVVDADDWSGPGGARRVLRDHRVEAASLEVARGGMLRRGLPVERADAAVVTNVAADHLGEYGILTVDDLVEAKLVVARAVSRSGTLVLNAGDDRLVEARPEADEVAWFSSDPEAPRFRAHTDAGGRGWTVVGGAVTEFEGGSTTPIVDVAAIPATHDGAAYHNVENALAATGAARCLGVAPDAIATGLSSFTGTAEDNPGRANVYDVDGATIIIDFAHNPHGMTAIARMAGAFDAERRLVLFGQAGDRGDDEIRELARHVWEIAPDRVVATEIPKYQRGRDDLEIPRLIVDELARCGAADDQLSIAPTPVDGVRDALAWARTGDVLVLMVLHQREEALELLRQRGARAVT